MLLMLSLLGCATDIPGEAPQVPPEMQVCPDPVAPPRAPPAPRTVDQLVEWTVKVWNALLATERGLKACGARLDKLNGWIGDNTVAKPPRPVTPETTTPVTTTK